MMIKIYQSNKYSDDNKYKCYLLQQKNNYLQTWRSHMDVFFLSHKRGKTLHWRNKQSREYIIHTIQSTILIYKQNKF